MGSTTLELLVEVVPFSRSPSEKKKSKGKQSTEVTRFCLSDKYCGQKSHEVF